MKILIIYGTTEGQTRKIARYMEDVLQQAGHQVAIADASEEPPAPDEYDAVLIGASIHVQKYQTSVEHYIRKHVMTLNKKRSAFFSVCMAVVSGIREEQEAAEKIAEQFLIETGWMASCHFSVAGALRYTRYDFFKKMLMKMIAARQGSSTDTSSDHEYTDWEDVRNRVLDFAGSLS